jgi:hypothetical protein
MNTPRLSVFVVVTYLAFVRITAAQEPPTIDRYRAVANLSYTVCAAFLRNLNALPPDEPAMVCEARLHPTHPEFSLPAWEELPIAENLPLIYETERLLWRFTPIGVEARPFEEWEQSYQERISSSEVNPRLRKTRVTMAGNDETLISYEPVANSCQIERETTGLSNGPGSFLFVLRADTGELQTFGGTLGFQETADVLLYRARSLQRRLEQR